MATDTFAGVSFLLLGLLATVVTVALIATRRKWSQVIMDHYVRSARQARPGMKWLWFAWRAPKWDDPAIRKRQLPGIWIPVIALPVMLGLIAFGAAAAHL